MNLTKHNVCLFIKDEEHLEEMREFLESKGEEVWEEGFYLSIWEGSDFLNNLLYYEKGDKWLLSRIISQTQVTTEQFKKLWESGVKDYAWYEDDANLEQYYKDTFKQD